MRRFPCIILFMDIVNTFIAETERLGLRGFTSEDEAALLQIWGNAEVMCLCGGGIDAELIRGMISVNLHNYREHGFAVFAVVRKADGVLVGAAGCKPDPEDSRCGELIYHFRSDTWGQGFASEAVAAYLAWLDGTRRLDRVAASALPGNAASLRILQKNGFIQKGFVQFEDTGYVPEPYFERIVPQEG